MRKFLLKKIFLSIKSKIALTIVLSVGLGFAGPTAARFLGFFQSYVPTNHDPRDVIAAAVKATSLTPTSVVGDRAFLRTLINSNLWWGQGDFEKEFQDPMIKFKKHSYVLNPNIASSPLIIDINRNDFQFSALGEKIYFDHDGDGLPENTQWVSPGTDDVFLALDLNGNNSIDSGRELFGDNTELIDRPGETANDGYQALAQYDSNSDGRINRKDEIWATLLLWNDLNGDGLSDSDELQLISGSNFRSIPLKPRDQHVVDEAGNYIPLWSWVRVKEDDGPGRLRMVDVFFSLL